MESLCFSEILSSTNKSTQHQNPEEQLYHPHSHENIKSHKYDTASNSL
jgi:hypothetical protein